MSIPRWIIGLVLGLAVIVWAVSTIRSNSWDVNGHYYFDRREESTSIRLRVRPDAEYRGIIGDFWVAGEHHTIQGDISGEALNGTVTTRGSGAHSLTNALLSGKLGDDVGIFQFSSMNPAIEAWSLTQAPTCNELIRRTRKSCRWGRYGASRDVTVTIPNVETSFLAGELLFEHLDALSGTLQAEFNRGFWGVVADGFKMPSASFDWTCHIDFDLQLVTETLVSVLLEQYEFTGGAHGNSGYEALNYYAPNSDMLQPFGQVELFGGGSEGMDLCSVHCLESLRRQGAAWVVDGTMDSLDLSSESVMTLSSNGLVFHFAPYAVGPYVQGSFRADVPGDLIESYLTGDPLGDAIRQFWEGD